MLVALSGMDGAGKSTAALDLAAALEAAGRPVIVHWTRLAGDPYLLELIGRPVAAVLRRVRPSDGGGGTAARTGAIAPVRPGHGRLVDAVWVPIVAADSVRAARWAFRVRRRGLTVVCDRWAADALVDLRLGYGRHPLAEWLLRRWIPAPDVGVFLEVDAATAATRKPGDQPLPRLEAMERLYADYAADLVRIDARADLAAVSEAIRSAMR
jgi:thymidylate kinase